MSASPEPNLTARQYLALERKSEARHIFIDGDVFAMAGASRAHNRIAGNVYRSLDEAFDDRDCEAFIVDMRVKIASANSYVYPDVVATCGSAEFAGDEFDSLVNPQVVVEVLSPSTESFDRVKKFKMYQQLDSLRHYVLISQDLVQVELFSKTGSGTWDFWATADSDDVLELPAISCSISVDRIYVDVDFPRDKADPLKIVREIKERYQASE
jgi:Uma2 family endonuclease